MTDFKQSKSPDHQEIAIYSKIYGKEAWPKAIVKEFKAYFSEYGVPYFVAGSEADSHFATRISKYKITVNRDTMPSCSGKHLYEHPFHYLSIRHERDYDMGDCWDLSKACGEEKTVRCRLGARQKQKLIVDARKSRKLDIMQAGPPGEPVSRPRMILISPHLRELLMQEPFKGFEIVPCLRAGEYYSEEEKRVPYTNDRLERLAPLYQLITTACAPGAPWVGKVLRIFSQCGRCGAIHGAYFETWEKFDVTDIDQSADIQRTYKHLTENHGVLISTGENLIISVRLLRFLRKNKVRGLAPFIHDPPIKNGIVQFR